MHLVIGVVGVARRLFDLDHLALSLPDAVTETSLDNLSVVRVAQQFHVFLDVSYDIRLIEEEVNVLKHDLHECRAIAHWVGTAS